MHHSVLRNSMTIGELNTLRCKKQPLQTQAKTLIIGSFSEDTLKVLTISRHLEVLFQMKELWRAQSHFIGSEASRVKQDIHSTRRIERQTESLSLREV